MLLLATYPKEIRNVIKMYVQRCFLQQNMIAKVVPSPSPSAVVELIVIHLLEVLLIYMTHVFGGMW